MDYSEKTANKANFLLASMIDALGEPFRRFIDSTKQTEAAFLRLTQTDIDRKRAAKAIKVFSKAMFVAGGKVEDMQNVSIALASIWMKGRPYEEDIRMLYHKVPQILSLLQDLYGTCDPKILEGKGITAERFFDEVTEALEKRNKQPFF